MYSSLTQIASSQTASPHPNCISFSGLYRDAVWMRLLRGFLTYDFCTIHEWISVSNLEKCCCKLWGNHQTTHQRTCPWKEKISNHGILRIQRWSWGSAYRPQNSRHHFNGILYFIKKEKLEIYCRFLPWGSAECFSWSLHELITLSWEKIWRNRRFKSKKIWMWLSPSIFW